MATLPTRIQAQASAITTTTLIHIVVTGDTSQSPQGSSYKATLGQLTSLFGGNTDRYITGGTYSSGTLDLFDNSGNTISVSGFYTDQDDIYVTGGTYNSLTTSLDFSGKTGFIPFSVDVSALLDDTNTFVTGGTYSTSTLTLNRNDGNSVIVTGFTDTNFANTNLTLTGNRTHNTSGYTFEVSNGGYSDEWFYLGGGSSYIAYGSNGLEINQSSTILFLNNENRLFITSGETVINENGLQRDFRVEGLGNANLIYADATGLGVGINKIPTSYDLDVNADARFGSGVVINDNANSVETRVEGVTDPNLLYVDSGSDRVGIGTPAPTEKLDVSGKTKTINFQMTSGATNGYVLTSDANGNAGWQSPTSFTGGIVTGETIFTGGLSATTISATTIGSPTDCVDDLYVSNIHSCSPLNINPLDEGNVYFGSTSGFTVDVNNGGNIYTKGDYVIQTNLIDPETLVPQLNSVDFKGYYQLYDYTGSTGLAPFNISTSGSTGIVFGQSVAPNPRKFGFIRYYGDDYIRDAGPPINGLNFYQNKVVYSLGAETNGTVVNIASNNDNGRYWFEQNGNSPMLIAGSGSPGDMRLGIALNPNGTEIPTAQLQVGGTGTTGTFRYIDGNQQSGYVLTSDASGNASWQVSTITGDTNFANTDLTFNGDRNHNTNGNHLAITTDNGLYNEGWIYLDNTLDGNNGSWIGYSSNHVRSYNQGNEISSSDGVFANVVEFFSGGTTFNTNTIPGVYFNVQTNSDQYSLYVDGTSGNVGIGIDTPTEKLDVSGKTKTINFQMTSGATNGYVLTSDANGNATWAETNMVNTNYNPTGNTITTSDNYVRYDLTGDTVVNLPSTAGSTPTPKEGQVLNIIKIGPNKLTLETSVTNSIQGAPDGQSPTPFTSGNALDLLSTNTFSVTLIYDGGLDSWVIMSCSDYNQIEYQATL